MKIHGFSFLFNLVCHAAQSAAGPAVDLRLQLHYSSHLEDFRKNAMLRVTEIDPKQIEHDSNLFQSAFWAHLKENRGYETQAFRIGYQDEGTFIIMVHRPCAADAAFGYVPRGPDIPISPENQGRFLESLSENIRQTLPAECRFLRYDLPWPNPYAPQDAYKNNWSGPPNPRIREIRMNFGSRNWNLRKAPTDMQPPATVVIDLRKSAPQILQGMHQKTRYCIRTAFRRGVVVRVRGREALPSWHRIYLDMAQRKGIVAEEHDYFHELFTTAHEHAPKLRIYLGLQNGELLAGSIIAFHQSTAYYLHSASSRKGRRLFASYAVLWKAMMDAKAQGCRRFDLLGIPPTGDPGHPMHGLFRFKTRFGGEIRHFRGCCDYPFDEARYPALALASGNHTPYHRP
jgi:lipid II:glycine glycyltransferase (peptidoglycan interpeptide bridge formation enzyme)